jgi:hypothetical protein
MKITDPHLAQFDAFEAQLRHGLDSIASATPTQSPDEFHPDLLPLMFDETSRRRVNPLLTAAAVAAVTVTGLVLIGSREDEPARTNQPTSAEPSTQTGSPSAVTEPQTSEPAFRFETATVLLEADTVEVITPTGAFRPTADVVVHGDPGMPEERTTLELTWHDGAEQRLFIYFASDGRTWWANEIRTYDGTDREDWLEPGTTGRFFESPLGTAYTGEIDLPNLRVTGVNLQAFVPPEACNTPTAPVALIADYPSIVSGTPGGYGASFQVFDTSTCTPLPIKDYAFEYAVDDPTVAVVTDNGPIPTNQDNVGDASATLVTAAGASPPPATPEHEFNDIKTRVGLDFPGPGSTTLHVTARDMAGAVIGTIDIPITVEPLDVN